ncbi:TetR/AcrR family transcriptional regulator [Paenibacillus agaridevorans]|uniref:TetR/AcrR family transcriptional regulator n=1 Tax=Paenibacillus agaridevorans TaxID=171404 RepID=UPI001BE40D69|nr:TetR/AcrR family transcriptional regulator [Paenibacillus agaridevorans]
MARPREYSDERILGGIYSALGKYGYAKLTLDNIAKEIEISPAALSKRFGSKKSMILFYLEAVNEGMSARFAELRHSQNASLQSLRTMFEDAVMKVDDPVMLANLTSVYIESVSDPELLERSRRRLRIIDETVHYFIGQALDHGELRSDNPEALARVLQSAIAGSLLIRLNDDTQPLKNWVEECFAVVLKSTPAAAPTGKEDPHARYPH